jgi:hypothetical protein
MSVRKDDELVSVYQFSKLVRSEIGITAVFGLGFEAGQGSLKFLSADADNDVGKLADEAAVSV